MAVAAVYRRQHSGRIWKIGRVPGERTATGPAAGPPHPVLHDAVERNVARAIRRDCGGNLGRAGVPVLTLPEAERPFGKHRRRARDVTIP